MAIFHGGRATHSQMTAPMVNAVRAEASQQVAMHLTMSAIRPHRKTTARNEWATAETPCAWQAEAEEGRMLEAEIRVAQCVVDRD